MPYAVDTDVPVERSKGEIERLLQRAGADQFVSGWDRTSATVAFRMAGKAVRIRMPLPDPADERFTMTPSKKWQRSQAEQQKAWEQACRARWRALKLILQAKLEAIELGVSTFEREFLADLLVAGGRTVGESAIPAIEEFYLKGTMPPLLPAGRL